MRTPVLPYDPRYQTRCPYCGSLGTEWHPAEGWGRCHAAGCLRSWRMFAPPGPPKMRTPDHLDLLDDAMTAQRRRMSFRDAFAVYGKLGVPGVSAERFDRAWREARSLA